MQVGGAAAEQPLAWVDEQGAAHPFARLAFGHGGSVHVQVGQQLLHRAGALPWFMAPLRAEGFLGRALARLWAAQGFPSDPAAWSIEQVLMSALQMPDAPGALRLGDDAGIARDRFIEALFERGIGCSVHYIPLHLHPYWRDRYELKPEQFPHSQRAYEQMLSLLTENGFVAAPPVALDCAAAPGVRVQGPGRAPAAPAPRCRSRWWPNTGAATPGC